MQNIKHVQDGFLPATGNTRNKSDNHFKLKATFPSFRSTILQHYQIGLRHVMHPESIYARTDDHHVMNTEVQNTT